MKNIEVLFTNRAQIRKILQSQGAEFEEFYSCGDCRTGGISLAIPDADVEDHFKALAEIRAQLRGMGMTWKRETSDGIEFETFDHRDRLGREIEYQIVSRFKAFFSIGSKVDPKTGLSKMVDQAQTPAIEKKLKYRSIEKREHEELGFTEVIVDGFTSDAPDMTISNALTGLFKTGTDAQMEEFLEILRTAGARKRPSRAQTAELDALLLSLARDRWVIVSKPLKREPAEAQFQSHFHGTPYFERSETWPLNKASRRPLDFVFQIVDPPRELLPSKVALIQFYYDDEECAHDSKSKGWLVKTYPSVNPSRAVCLQRPAALKAKRFCTIALERDKSLPEWFTVKWGQGRINKKHQAEILALCSKVNPEVPEDAYERAVARLVKHRDTWSFLAGYAREVQDQLSHGKARFVLQVGSDSKRDLMWGDCGAVYLSYAEGRERFLLEMQCC